ncbi:MAG TPA: hypothetical protein VFH27_08760 [Longimicrobiaceae bacterium]|nr:hypothetical protein [Longimicrobiaceae bacterium]
MKPVVLVASMLLLAACAARDTGHTAVRRGTSPPDSSVLWPARGIVLGRAEAHVVVRQCSRAALDTGSVRGYWTPSRPQIAELEAGLTPLLRSKLEGDGNVRRFRREHLSEYFRQYAGLVVGPRRIIYVNGFMTMDTTTWRHPEIVCDGGANFFGVEYDPATRVFSGFSFNGSA